MRFRPRKQKHMRHALFTAVLGALFLGSSCKPLDPYTYVSVTGPITIGEQATEVVFQKPFTPKKQVNELCLVYDERLKIVSVPQPPVFPDGTPWVVSVKLFESSGKLHELNSITRNQEGYVCYTPENYVEWIRVSKQDIEFSRISLASNEKMDLKKIEWKTYDSWDLK